jgi:heme-degrading monooxygenase HmoA
MGLRPFTFVAAQGRIALTAHLLSESGVTMVARVTHYRVRVGKVEEFTATAASLVAAMDKLNGFRGLFILRGEEPGSRDVMGLSVWDSDEDMKSSESNTYYYDVIARLMGCCESFSPMHKHEVLISRFPNL